MLFSRYHIALAKRDTSATVVLHKVQIREDLYIELGPKGIILLYIYLFIENDFVDFVTIASDFMNTWRK